MGKIMEKPRYPLVQVIGAGPAGLSLPIAAESLGTYDALLHAGLVMIDTGEHIGEGKLSSYHIHSNSEGGDFYSNLHGRFKETIPPELLASEQQIILLPFVGALLHTIGKLVEQDLSASQQSAFLPRTHIDAIHLSQDTTPLFTSVGGTREIATSRNIVLAPGAYETHKDTSHRDKTFLSGDVITEKRLAEITERLTTAEHPSIVIKGGSHSAFSVAWKLLQEFGDLPFDDGAITILHRSPIKLFASTVDEADEKGIVFNKERDVCSKTGRINRFSGIRNDAQAIYLNIKRGELPQFQLSQVADFSLAQDTLTDATLIIQCLGYHAQEIPIFDSRGNHIGPQRTASGRVIVTTSSQLLTHDGNTIPKAYAIGLGHGRLPSPEIGGEKSAQHHPVDAVNFFHGVVGQDIVTQLLHHRT